MHRRIPCQIRHRRHQRASSASKCAISSSAFPGVLANDRVCFDVDAGEVHALLGENGAGKSTLMRQLYGLYRPDEGQILIDGKPHVFHSPADAIRAGIGMIHQHFMLVPTLTVAENVALGLKSSREPLLDLDKVAERVTRAVAGVWPEGRSGRLRLAALGRRAAARRDHQGALSRRQHDHPGRADRGADPAGSQRPLCHPQAHGAAKGTALVFISHKLHEVMAISDRVTVLRDGRMVGTQPIGEVDARRPGEDDGRPRGQAARAAAA